MHSINHCGIIIAFGKSINVDFLGHICECTSLQTKYKVMNGVSCETKEISYQQNYMHVPTNFSGGSRNL